jgi:hypothetical protein
MVSSITRGWDSKANYARLMTSPDGKDQALLALIKASEPAPVIDVDHDETVTVDVRGHLEEDPVLPLPDLTTATVIRSSRRVAVVVKSENRHNEPWIILADKTPAFVEQPAQPLAKPSVNEPTHLTPIFPSGPRIRLLPT